MPPAVLGPEHLSRQGGGSTGRGAPVPRTSVLRETHFVRSGARRGGVWGSRAWIQGPSPDETKVSSRRLVLCVLPLREQIGS